MRKLLSALPLLFASSLVLAQAAAEPPLEAQTGMGAVIAFGVFVLIGVIAFLVFMVRHNARKGQSGADAAGNP